MTATRSTARDPRLDQAIGLTQRAFRSAHPGERAELIREAMELIAHLATD